MMADLKSKTKNIEAAPQINQNYTERVVVNTYTESWNKSPCDGVERIYLERNNMGEKAIATSIVRFAPKSYFEEHTHEAGEEFFVLDGIFEDEYGIYSKGTYIRNPHGTTHNPFSRAGCTIFVKLRQFRSNDKERIVKDTTNSSWLPGLVPGLSVMPLHEFENERTALVQWKPNTHFNTHQHWGGEEIFVLEGTFFDEYGIYPKGSWIRSPHLSRHKPYTEKEGAIIFVKTGNLECD